MPTKVVRIRDRNQITLPAEVVETAYLQEGDFLEVTVTEASVVTLKPKRLVAWNTPEAEQEDKKAEEDISEKRYRTFASASAFSEDLLRSPRPSTASRSTNAPRTEADIVKQIAGHTGMRTQVVRKTVESFLIAVAQTLQSGHQIEIRGLGTFRVEDRKARITRNRRTGKIGPQRRKVPVFSVSKKLKDMVEEG